MSSILGDASVHANVCFGPRDDVTTISPNGSARQLQPVIPCPSERRALAESGHWSLAQRPVRHVFMTYERVHTIWDLYDGIRTGIADLNGAPHYFASQFDEGAYDYSDNFKLYPVGAEFMERAMRNWAIYRAWERHFHSGEAKLETHPGHGGIDAVYDELKSWLDAEVGRLQPLPTLYKAKFRELPGQDDLPGAMLRETEVAWSPSSALGQRTSARHFP